MNQEAFFAVSDYVTNSVSPLHLIKNMQKAADYMASVGIGMIHSVSGVGFSHNLDVDIGTLFQCGIENGMSISVYFPNHGYRKGNQNAVLQESADALKQLSTVASAQKTHLFSHRMKTVTTAEFLYYSDEKVTEFL